MPPCMSAGPSLPSRALADELAQLLRDLAARPCWSASRITGTTRPLGVSTAKPMWKYCFRTRLSPSSEALNSGNCFSAATRALIRNASIVTLTPAFSFSLLSRDAEGLELGDVGLVVLGDVRDHHPVAGEVRAGDLPDPRQRLRLDRAELREVDRRPRQQVERAAADAARRCAGRAGRAPRSACLTKLCTSSWRMRPFGPVPATRARSTPSSRAKRRTDGEACAALNASPSIGAAAGRRRRRGPARARGSRGASRRAGAAAALRRWRGQPAGAAAARCRRRRAARSGCAARRRPPPRASGSTDALG